jgi:hypothetical protein
MLPEYALRQLTTRLQSCGMPLMIAFGTIGQLILPFVNEPASERSKRLHPLLMNK